MSQVNYQMKHPRLRKRILNLICQQACVFQFLTLHQDNWHLRYFIWLFLSEFISQRSKTHQKEETKRKLKKTSQAYKDATTKSSTPAKHLLEDRKTVQVKKVGTILLSHVLILGENPKLSIDFISTLNEPFLNFSVRKGSSQFQCCIHDHLSKLRLFLVLSRVK